MNAFKHKAVAAWLALLGGSLGLHRFYLFGLRDPMGWLLPLPTMAGLVGWSRFRTLGADDAQAAWLLPLLGLMLAQGAFTAIYYGLMADERWNARHNPQASEDATRWGPVLAAITGLLLGGTALMSAIVFAAQRYFELNA